MIKYITITLFFLLSSFMVHAQSNGCDGSRYIDDIFSEVKITSNIAYGNNTTIGGRNRTFYMDIYEPKNDQMTARPTVILAHGGSFIGGSKNEFVRLGSDLAKKGYVVASISYRLIDGLILDSIGMSEGVVMAIGDMRAAVRYLKNNAITSNDYGINADIIFAGGTSAGGVMASHVGMLDADDVLPDYLNEHIIKHGGLEGNTNDITNVNSTVVGVLNYSGALARANWIDTNDPPFLSVHDELDETVPCGYGRVGAVWFPAYLYGSCAMNTRAIEQGVQNDITIYPGDGHVSYMFDEHYDEVVVKSSIFMENVICEQLVDVDDAQTLTFAIGPNPAYDKIKIQGVPGGQLKYIVYDNFGHTVRHDQFQGDLTIKVSSLPTGIYAIKIMSEEGREGSQFFIKN